jgi:hypothetical protein
MKRLIAAVAVAAALVVAAPAQASILYTSFQGGLPGGDYHLSASEHHWLYGVSSIHTWHGGVERWGKEWPYITSSTGASRAFNARMKDGQLLYIYVGVQFHYYSNGNSRYTVSLTEVVPCGTATCPE